MRILADDEKLFIQETSASDSMNAGNDNNLDDSELEVIAEISQDEPKEWYAAIESVPNEDQGTVDPHSDDEGTSLMTWIMYIGGAVLGLALIGGGIFLCMQNKDAEKFSHENDTEMSREPTDTPTHGHHHAHHG